MKGETFLKIGKYGRPMFWSFLVVYSLEYLWLIILDIVSGDFFEFTGIFMGSFMLIVVLISASIGIYKVTHPHISNTEYDDLDASWAVGITILGSVLLIHMLLLHFFNFNLLDYFLSGDPNDLVI